MFWNFPKFDEDCKSSAHSQKRGEQIYNYKPIPILPVSFSSKILEILIYKRVVTFLNKYNMISEAQNGFREKRSTNTATQIFTEDIQKALNNTLLVMGIFLGLTEAFDVISHKLLPAKLELHGLRGKIHSWMSSYHTGRTQFVEIQQLDEKISNIKMYTSSCKEIKYGVPLGSVLRPLLFLLFINDLPKVVQEAKLLLFADDTNILLTEKNLTSLKGIP